jgi:HlyD family secretion protein
VETRRAKVERGDIVLHVTATGEIKPVKEVELKSKASGQVVRFQKQPGDAVDEGELIAELDKRMEQRNLTLQESNLLSAEANLSLVKLKADADLKTTESESAAMREDEKQKRAELARLEKLSGEFVSESELSAIRLASRLAEERAKQAEAALTLIKGRRDGDVRLAEADVLKARVAVDDARERLRDTDIRSPIKGILLKKLVEEGVIVASGISANTGGTAIALVADVSTLLVEANVDQADIAKVRKDQPVQIKLKSESSERFRGKVELIVPKSELDNNVIIFKVRIAMGGSIFGKVYPGMAVSVEIKVAETHGALTVPSEAVRIEKQGPVVYVPDGEKSKPVSVKYGLDDGVKAEILGGLDLDAEIYVNHISIPEKQGGRSSRIRF